MAMDPPDPMILIFYALPCNSALSVLSCFGRFPAEDLQLFSICPAHLRYHTYYSLIRAVLIVKLCLSDSRSVFSVCPRYY